MFDLLASFRFWINIIIGHLPIYLLLSCYSMAFGAVRNKKLKVDAIFLTFFVIIAIFVLLLLINFLINNNIAKIINITTKTVKAITIPTNVLITVLIKVILNDEGDN